MTIINLHNLTYLHSRIILEPAKLPSTLNSEIKCNVKYEHGSIHHVYPIRNRRLSIKLKNHVTYTIEYTLEPPYYE